MAFVYIAADSFELEPFAATLTNLRKLRWPVQYAVEGVYRDHRAVLVANGAGPKLAIQAAEIAFRAFTVTGLASSTIQAIVSTGFCGALVDSLQVNDIVVGSEVLDRQIGRSFACATVDSSAPFASGTIVSQDRIASSAAEKGELAASGAIAVEMEAAGVAAYAERTGLPFACIKVVSDAANESFPFDLNQMRTIEGRIARGKIGIYALRHPVLLPALWKLKQRSDRAARTLGEFLVSCTISTEAGRIPSE